MEQIIEKNFLFGSVIDFNRGVRHAIGYLLQNTYTKPMNIALMEMNHAT